MNHWPRLLTLALLLLPVGAASAQVSLFYEPTTLDPGVATEVTISLREDFGDGFNLDAVGMVFEAPDGLTLSDFMWLPDDFNDLTLWFISTGLPAPQAAAFASGFVVEGNEEFDLASVIVTADANASGSMLTLNVFTDSDAVIRDLSLNDPLAITEGRTVTFTVTGSGGGGDGGTGGGGGSGGGGSMDDPDDTDDDMPPGDDDDDPMDDDPADDDSSDDDPTDDDGGDVPGDGDGGDGGSDDGGDGDDDMVDDGGDGAGDDMNGDDGGDGGDDSGDDGDSDMVPNMMPFCGPGMILPSLFALTALSVMKVHRRRGG